MKDNIKVKNGDVYQRGSNLVLYTNQGETIYLNKAGEHSIRDAGTDGDVYVCNASDLQPIKDYE
jgi:hypothetical protein